MIIAIDARSLEEHKTGINRYLSGLLRYWKNNKQHKFILYFKDEIPNDDLLKSDNFELKLLKNSFKFSSNFFFQHFLLPYNLKKDKANFFFSPFYLKPIYCSIKSAIVLHDISYEAHPEWFDFKSKIILKLLSKFSAKTTDLIFTVSNYSKSEIVKCYKINPDKITVTHLGVDSNIVGGDKKLSVQRDAQLLEYVKLDLNSKFILCVGSMFSRRHVPEIIEAFEKIANKYKDYQLLIIGKNHTHPFVDINNKIKTANNNLGRKAIIHLDFVEEEELLLFYSSCNISIYLSDYEGFGLPIIEAQFFGKPVITSYNSSLIEVGGDSVEFVRNNGVEEIYNSLNEIISDENYKNRLVELGNKNVGRFSWEKCADKTLEKILNIKY
ncbi:MAG: glycosyltransferase family 4 protein [Candidatus Pacebacteria bacterium]|nr:glycosyltransferase family 4 protein [Candidatus Paceibacterota bacterium]